MQQLLRLWLLAALLTLPTAFEARASRLFFSKSPNAPTEKSGGVNPTITVAENGRASLYLWYQPTDSNHLIGLGHDILTFNPILTRFSYKIDNPSISGSARWSGSPDAGQTSANLLVDDAGAFNLTGSSFGFDGAADPLYHAASDTYRFSVLQFTAEDPGTTILRLAVGDAGIAFAGQPSTTEINFGFNDDSIPGDSFGVASIQFDATVNVVAADPTKPWKNPVTAVDVNADTLVTPLDALLVINDLNSNGAHTLVAPTLEVHPPSYVDPDGDNFLKPLDALTVINFLNNPPSGGSGFGAFGAPIFVPEPGAMALAICGLLAFGCARKIKRIGSRIR